MCQCQVVDVYTDNEITNAVDYLFKILDARSLSTGELALASWINDRMLAGYVNAGTISEIRLAMASEELTERL